MKKVLFIVFAGLAAFACTKPGPGQPVSSLDISENSLQFSDEGGDGTVLVDCNGEWTVSLVTETDWISFDATATQSGKAEFSFSVAPNDTEKERTAEFKFTSSGVDRTLAIEQDAPAYLLSPSTLHFDNMGDTKTVTVTLLEGSSTFWNVSKDDESVNWFTVKKLNDTTIEVTVDPNPGAQREVRFTVGTRNSDKKKKATIIQEPVDNKTYYADKEVVQLEKATVGHGVELIVMGEGYQLADMKRDGSGLYESVARQAVDNFFSVYPYSEYREYFNVWMVGAVSKDAGMRVEFPPYHAITAFGCTWAGEPTTALSCNEAAVLEYTELVLQLTGKTRDDVTVIMPINMNVYAGTCIMTVEGFSCAMVPVGETFRNVIVHEVGGHGFAKLADEYYSNQYPDQTVSEAVKRDVTEYKAAGHMDNVDLHGDIAQTTWAAFAGNPKYTGPGVDPHNRVGTYEGAYFYGKGIWRPEENSCMNDNVLYFNAPSRWAMVERIMKLSGVDENYTVEKFMAEDVIPAYPAAETPSGRSRATAETFRPLGEPIFMP
jgi:hypothetical protein